MLSGDQAVLDQARPAPLTAGIASFPRVSAVMQRLEERSGILHFWYSEALCSFAPTKVAPPTCSVLATEKH